MSTESLTSLSCIDKSGFVADISPKRVTFPLRRLVMDKLILENFKSYYGIKVIGPFHPRFSCIVGGNGSGKSNIIDAILFIFGHRANQLRQKNFASLIHKSHKHPNVKYARVSAYFHEVIKNSYDNFENDEVLEGTSLLIAHEISTDGFSRYSINGMHVSQKDIIACLKTKNLNLEDTRFLILQGEVEKISMMKPKGQNTREIGLLEYIEDIIGSNKYIEEINKEKEAIDKINETFQEKRDKITVAQNQLNILEGPLKLIKQICWGERQELLLKSQIEEKNLLTMNIKIQEWTDQLSNVQREFDVWKEKRSEEQQKINTINIEIEKQENIIKKAEQMMKSVDGEFSSLENLDNEIAAKQTQCSRKIQNTKKEILRLETDKDNIISESQSFFEKITDYENEIELLEKSSSKLESELEALDKLLQSEFDILREKKEAAEQLYQPEELKLAELTSNMDIIKTKISLIEEKREESLKRRSNVSQKVSETHAQLQNKDKQLAESTKAIEKQKKIILKKKEDLDTFKEVVSKEDILLQNDKDQLSIFESKLQSCRVENVMIPRILASKEEGKLTGVIDRLWNLGTIDDELKLAMSVVAGNEYIIVEQTEHAQKVIEFVRSNNLGRITCIVLTKINQELEKDMKNLDSLKIPEESSLLINHIHFVAPQFKIAFYFILRDILLVPNIDIARKVAFGGSKRWKVVTLEGHIIDKAGSMSGGGTSNAKIFNFKKITSVSHSFDRKETKEIESLKLRIRDKSSEYDLLHQKLMKKESELHEAERYLENLKHQTQKYLVEVDTLKSDISHYEIAFRECKIVTFSIEDQRQLDQLNNQLQKSKDLVSKQTSTKDELKENVYKITLEIEQAGGEKRQSLKKRYNSTYENLNMKKQELHSFKVQEGVRKNRMKQIITLIEEKSNQLTKDLNREKQLNEERNDLTDRAEIVLKKREELDKILTGQRQILENQNHSLQELISERKSWNSTEVNYETKIYDIQQSLNNLESSHKKILRHLNGYKEKWINVPKFPDFDNEEYTFHIGVKNDNKSDISEKNYFIDGMKFSENYLMDLDEGLLFCEIKKLTESTLSEKIDMSVIEKHQHAKEKLDNRLKEFEEICKERESINRRLESLKTTRLNEFTVGFLNISAKVKEMYQMITYDGDAELELVDSSSPFDSGIIFSVRPPKKSWKQIQNLSGGEKTISSLSLIFALHQYRPTPIYFLDEIDSALDNRNISTIALYLTYQSYSAQFIVVSLRNNMFELADRLIGIFKVGGKTNSVSIDPNQFVRNSKEHDNSDFNSFKKKFMFNMISQNP